jgi:6-phosphogluconate dehydrogenase
LFDLILAAPSPAATRNAWIILQTKSDFSITEGFIGRSNHVDNVRGRIISHGKAGSLKLTKPREAWVMVPANVAGGTIEELALRMDDGHIVIDGRCRS